jgi:hypothetical protein
MRDHGGVSMFKIRIGFGFGLGLALALSAGGCDSAMSRNGQGGGASSAEVNGSVGGVTLNVMDKFAATTQASSSGGGSTVILITDTAGVCSAAVRGEQLKSVGGLTLIVYATDGAGKSVAPTQTGTYTVSKGAPAAGMKYAVGGFGGSDEQCKAKTFTLADSGKVELTRIDASSYAGTFDLMFGSDHVTGNFDVSECAGRADKLTCT